MIADIHAPFVDWQFTAKVTQVARKLKIRNLLIAGDFWNYDHLKIYEDAIPPPTWATERAAGKLLMKSWASWFRRVEMLTGNHERRKSKQTGGQEDDEDIFSPLAAVHPHLRSTIYGWCNLQSGEECYRITHPAAYRQAPLSVANELAQKFHCHIVSWHEHHFGISFDRYGRYLIINGGILADYHKFDYVVLDDNIRPTMKQGFVAIKDGYPYLFGVSPFTDWTQLEK